MECRKVLAHLVDTLGHPRIQQYPWVNKKKKNTLCKQMHGHMKRRIWKEKQDRNIIKNALRCVGGAVLWQVTKYPNQQTLLIRFHTSNSVLSVLTLKRGSKWNISKDKCRVCNDLSLIRHSKSTRENIFKWIRSDFPRLFAIWPLLDTWDTQGWERVLKKEWAQESQCNTADRQLQMWGISSWMCFGEEVGKKSIIFSERHWKLEPFKKR